AANGTPQAEAGSVALEVLLQLLAIQSAQGHGRRLDHEALAVAQGGIDEDLAGVAEADALDGLIEGADQEQAPEALDGGGRLAVAAEPIVEWLVRVGRSEAQASEGGGDAELVAGGEEVGGEEAAREVERCRQEVGDEAAAAAIGSEEVERG